MSFIAPEILAGNHHDGGPISASPLARADADMRYVLEALRSLDGRPTEVCVPAQSRQQPGLDAALRKLLSDQHRAEDDVATSEHSIETADGPLALRVYRGLQLDPTETAPVILYLHGGWVRASLDNYDATPRLLARKTGAVVVAPHYRRAPEHRFPAAHVDAYAAWLWLTEAAETLGVDLDRAAVVGESMGGNLALNVALQARDEAMLGPVHTVLLYPLAGSDLTLPSYAEHARSGPLNAATVRWMVRHAFANRADAEDKRINLMARTDLGGIAPVTLILAELDPLRSEGEMLAGALNAQGVMVDATTYDGVTHDFFGLGLLVNKAMFAQSQVVNNLKEAFAAGRRRG